ncbi:hypothetical protein [Lysobacter antibioticus]|uniref:Uncharacterized protein n=1 Tax=Lysobacter antibioticus TaxID=84531 RepID=A0A0S2F8M2_LYSAN|nr:hypothetical protein [Lysobacter antibioticus]ALN79789.1 hypothetical protein LA76x_1633 [Lysobacter antibioticus]
MNPCAVARQTFVAVAAVALLGACERTPSAPAAAKPAAHAPQPATTPQTNTPAAEKGLGTAPPAKLDHVLPGALAPDTGPAQLRALFGADQVEISDHLPGAEGEEFRGVILYPKDSALRAYLYFQDSQQLRGLSNVVVREPDSRWRLDNGVSMGMRLAELVRLNGKPIRFSGLDWDYGGAISDWNGGRLAAKDGDPVIRHARLDRNAQASTAQDAYPSGDSEFSSDDKRYPQQGELLSVGELRVSFPGEDDL